MRHDELVNMVGRRYAPPHYAFLPQVRSATGAAYARTADAIAMGVWPSRGLDLMGFECKVSRRDWLRELNKPAKAETICRLCDRWWIVAADASIVQPGELPKTWGLLVAKGGKLHLAVDAPQLEPEPITRKFLAAILRNAQGRMPTDQALREEYERGKRAGEAEAKQEAAWSNNNWHRKCEELVETIRQFQERSGINISRYDGPRVAEAVRVILASKDIAVDLKNHMDAAKRLLRAVERSVESMEKEFGNGQAEAV